MTWDAYGHFILQWSFFRSATSLCLISCYWYKARALVADPGMTPISRWGTYRRLEKSRHSRSIATCHAGQGVISGPWWQEMALQHGLVLSFWLFEFGLVLRQVYDRMRDVVGSQPHQVSEKDREKRNPKHTNKWHSCRFGAFTCWMNETYQLETLLFKLFSVASTQRLQPGNSCWCWPAWALPNGQQNQNRLLMSDAENLRGISSGTGRMESWLIMTVMISDSKRKEIALVVQECSG